MFHVKQKKDEVKRCVMYCDDENEGGENFVLNGVVEQK